jgi:hypothetical protein
MSPNNSSGTRQQFSFTVADPQGHDDIDGLQAVFLSSWSYTCHVTFNAQWNLLSFRLDNGTWTEAAIGSAQAPTNSNCTLYAATSSVARTGNQLTLTLDLQFKPAFAGQKRVEAAASDYAGNIVGYQEVGRWLVPGTPGTSQASPIQFWAPAQVSPGQSFQAMLVMRNTGPNIWQWNTLNSSQPHRLVSWNPQGNSTWGVSSIELPVEQVLPGHDVTIMINATAPATEGTYNFEWRMLHQGVEVFGTAASTAITVTPTPYPESPHPYANNMDQTWSYSNPRPCDFIEVRFDSLTQVLAGDLIYVMDAGYAQIPGSPFTGTTLAGATVRIPGRTVRVRLTTDGNGTAFGFRVVSVTPGCNPTPFADDFNADVSYSGMWYHDTQFSQPARGTISYSDSPWASVQYTFCGRSIQFVHTKAFNRGMAHVYIDGVFHSVVDQYTPGIAWQSIAYIEGLSPEYHTITIYVTGIKQAASQWHWVDVDGFQPYP